MKNQLHKKLNLIAIGLMMCFVINNKATAQMFGGCAELHISEYIEGSGKNRAIEVYNPKDTTVDLIIYSIKVYTNGSPNANVIQLSGNLAPNEVYVIGHPQADSAIVAVCDMTSTELKFNGDDAVGLYRNDTLIDMIGEIGVSPGNTGWQVGIGSTKDNTLVRGLDVRDPTPYWTVSVLEWDVYAMDDISNLGFHNSKCATDSISWYRYGEKIWWQLQKDVYTFRFANGQQYAGTVDTAVVENVIYNPNSPRKLNEFHFKAGTTPAQREIEKNKARASANYEDEYEVVTKEPAAPKEQEKWVKLNDLVIVIFKDPYITYAQAEQFGMKYKVFLYREPYSDLPAYAHGFYAFRKDTNDLRETSTIAKQMWEGDNAILLAAEPYMQLRIQPNLTCPINDTYYNYNSQRFLWHINNNGTLYNSNGTQTSTNDADPDICECWDAGYTGSGMRIGVIDFHGFEWTHEDLGGQFVDGWDCINDVAYTSTTPLPPYVSGEYHGTTMSGTIGAVVNNSKGVAGVAPNAKIIPLLISTTDVLTFGKALERVLIDNADVVNMSFGFTSDYSPWHILVQEADTLGRPDPTDTTIKYGTVFVAAAGNNDALSQQWPAAWDEVIGVIGTNPNDYRHSGTDGWGVGPSNYGFWYSVAAPGAFITSLSFMGRGNPNLGNDYINSGGTSFASATVSGIAGILLSQTNQLTSKEIRDTIIFGVQKVRSGTYNNYNDDPVNYPGQSEEMGHGRVNCLASLTGVSGTDELADKPILIKVTNPVTDKLIVHYHLNKPNEQLKVRIYDVLGRELYKGTLPAENITASIDVRHFQNGAYLIVFHAKDGGLIQSNKFIKF